MVLTGHPRTMRMWRYSYIAQNSSDIFETGTNLGRCTHPCDREAKAEPLEAELLSA